MNLFIRLALAGALLSATAAATQYTQSVSGSSFTINHANHGIASASLAAALKDGSGNLISRSSYTVQVNLANYDVSYSGLAGGFSGTAILQGPLPTSDTGNSGDFQAVIDGLNTQQIHVCPNCGSTPARDTDGALGMVYYMACTPTITINSAISNGSLNIWLSGGVLYIGTGSTNGAVSLTASGCGAPSVAYSTAGFPANVTQLATCTWNGSAQFSSCTDKRPQGW